jgi:micrococcal nuclease
MYKYKAKVIRVIDGDTIECRVDLGFHVSCTQRFRLLDVDAPEVRGPEKGQGLIIKHKLRELIEGLEVEIESEKTGKFGRWLAHIRYRNLNINKVVREWTEKITKDIDAQLN